MKSASKLSLGFVTGFLTCFLLFGGAVAFAASGITAEPSNHKVFIDGEQLELEAYVIDGSNYVKLRDVGAAVGFEVYWDGTVQIETDKPYTGSAPTGKEAPEEQTTAQTLVELINELRRERGLNKLVVSDGLMAAAQERADICAESGSIQHDKELSAELLEKFSYRHLYCQ